MTARRLAATALLIGVLAACQSEPDDKEPVVVEPKMVNYTYGVEGKPGAGVSYTCRSNDILGECYTRLPASGAASWKITITANDYLYLKVDAPKAKCWIRRNSKEVDRNASEEDDPNVSESRQRTALCSDTVYGQEW
jgi:hypothetical protein